MNSSPGLATSRGDLIDREHKARRFFARTLPGAAWLSIEQRHEWNHSVCLSTSPPVTCHYDSIGFIATISSPFINLTSINFVVFQLAAEFLWRNGDFNCLICTIDSASRIQFTQLTGLRNNHGITENWENIHSKQLPRRPREWKWRNDDDDEITTSSAQMSKLRIVKSPLPERGRTTSIGINWNIFLLPTRALIKFWRSARLGLGQMMQQWSAKQFVNDNWLQMLWGVHLW